MKSHHDMEVWKSAIALAKKVYAATDAFRLWDNGPDAASSRIDREQHLAHPRAGLAVGCRECVREAAHSGGLRFFDQGDEQV